MSKITLGCEAIDLLTGMKGLLGSKLEMLSGCVQYAIQPKVKEGAAEMPNPINIDLEQLQWIGAGISDRARSPGVSKDLLGKQVRDKVSGFKGIATGRVTFLNGCVFYHVETEIETELPRDMERSIFVSNVRLEEVGAGLTKELKPVKSGGPSTLARRASC